MNKSYIVVTPARNEESNLLDVADSMIKQTIKPKLWLIVDDGSTDDTPVIIQNLEAKYNWIKTIRLPPRSRDITFHYSYVCKKGFDYANEYCEKVLIIHEFIGLLDADTVLEEHYFEKIFNEFKRDKSLGIASGGIYYNINGKLKWLKGFQNLPSGTGRVWIKDCFFDTKGYLVEPSPDSISNVKAILHGWKTKNFKNIMAIQKRWTSSAEGLWKGYKIDGKMAHYLNKHPLLVLLNAIYFTKQKPHYLSIPYTYGYLSSSFKKERQIDEEDIKNYYWNTRIRELIQRFLSRIRIDVNLIV